MTQRSPGTPTPRRAAWAALAGGLALLTACGGGSGGDAAAPAANSAAISAATLGATPRATASDSAVAGAANASYEVDDAEGLKSMQAAGPAPAAKLATQRDAVRLAHHASFGPSEALVASIRTLGTEAWVAQQVVATGSRYTSGQGGSIHQPEGTDFCAGKGDTCWRDFYSSQPLLWDFYRNALNQPDQLRQRMAFALAQILVISEHEVSGTYGFRRYHNDLLANAFGNYREVLRKVARSPMMGEYLDHVNNDKAQPNENFARELLQLFTLGTCLLNPDGTLVGGRCQPTYDNARVRDYAFALTGWTYPAGGSSVWGCWPVGANCRYLDGEMVGKGALQDQQPRLLLGGVTLPASRTPVQALDAVLDSLMNHPNLAPFIGRQLIQHLVKSNPSPAYVQRVAGAFASGRFTTAARSFGTGQRGDLAATVAAILLDTEARDSGPGTADEKLREPVLMMTGVLRALNGRTDGDALAWWWGEELRQHVFRAPSVFNFYPPDFPVAGTRKVGPAFGIHNANTEFARLNYLNQLLFWGGMAPGSSVPGAVGTQVNLAAFHADAADANLLVNRLFALATGGVASAATRAQIVAAVQAWGSDITWTDWRLERVRTAAYLVFASPAYQVMR